MSRHHIVNSNDSGQDFINEIRRLYAKHKYLIISVNVGFDRTAAQNKLQHKWYTEMSQQSGDMTNEEWRAYCKLAFGVKIAMQDEALAESWHAVINSMTHEKLLKFIELHDIAVTRNFSKEQMSEFLGKVYEFGCQQGWRLTEPKAYDRS